MWNKIIEAINGVWPSIQVIFKQGDLLKATLEEIQKTKDELDNKPKKALELIKFLNNKNRQELEELEIIDRTETILEIRKVITKKNLMKQLEEKCENMSITITRFMVKFENLRQRSLPNILVINEKLMPQEDYNKKIKEYAKEQVEKVGGGQGIPTRKVLLRSFEDLFYLQHEIRHLFVIKPTFSKYTEAYENFRKLKKIQIPSEKDWQSLTNLL